MNGTINTGEAIEPGENYNPPSAEEIEERMTALEDRGVSVVLQCGECDGTAETTVLPEETDESQKTICRDCMTDHLRKKALL